MGVCLGIISSGMSDCDFLGGYINGGGSLVLRDGTLNGIGTAPTQDTTTSIIASNHSQTTVGSDTITIIKIKRSAERKQTNEELKAEEIRSSWAYTNSKSWTSAHSGSNSRGTTSMDLSASKDNPSNPALTSLFPFHYVVLGVVAITLCILGFLITFLKAFHLTMPFQLLLFRPLLKYPLPYVLHYTPAVLLTMSLGELIVVGGYLLYIASAVGYTIGNAFLASTWISPGDPITRLIGELALFHISLLICASSRYSIFFVIFGIPFDRAIRYHQAAGFLAYLFLTVHGFIMLIEYAVSPVGILYIIQWSADGIFWVGAGPIAFLSFTLMIFFALPFMRRRLWEVFRIIHFILFHVSIIFVFLHMKTKYLNYIYIGAPYLLYLIDMILRFVNYVIPAKIVKLKAHPNINVTEITVKRSFIMQPRAGQYMFLYIPKVSLFQSHPFSIVNVPYLDNDSSTVRFMVKGIGGFTRSLLKHAEKEQNPFIRLEGPYGAPALPVNFYNQFLFVAGGIGITPMMSHTFDYIVSNASTETMHMAHLVWIVRKQQLAALLKDTLMQLQEKIGKHGHAFVDIYVTRGGDDDGELFDKELKEVDEKDGSKKESSKVSYRVHAGRPAFKEIIEEVRQSYHKATSCTTYPPMGVMACGPSRMVKDVHRCCASADSFPSNMIHFQQHEFLF